MGRVWVMANFSLFNPEVVDLICRARLRCRDLILGPRANLNEVFSVCI